MTQNVHQFALLVDQMEVKVGLKSIFITPGVQYVITAGIKLMQR